MKTAPDPISRIAVHELAVSFVDGRRSASVEALAGVSLEVLPGEVLAVVGPSGCGKTTLLRTVAGLIHERTPGVRMEGEVRVGGQTPLKARSERHFGFVFQKPVLLPWRTVQENVRLPVELQHDDLACDDRVNALLTLVGIDQFKQSRPHELSGGMQQRVSLARALVHRPSCLLMDEPFGALDELTREHLNLVLLKLIATFAPAVLLVTHSLREAAFLGDRVVVMSARPATIIATLAAPSFSRDAPDAQLHPEYLEHLRALRATFRSHTA